MARTARHLKADLHHKLDDAIGAGKQAVLVVAMLAVGREGLETALFLWAGAQATSGTAGTGPNFAPLVGAALGPRHRGARRLAHLPRRAQAQPARLLRLDRAVPRRRRRRRAAYGVHDLQEAGILPGLNNLAFDVSATVPPSSWYGSLLKGVFNFSPATTVAPGGRLDRLPRADDVLLHPHHVGLRARPPVGARRRAGRARHRRLIPLPHRPPALLRGDPCPAAPPPSPPPWPRSSSRSPRPASPTTPPAARRLGSAGVLTVTSTADACDVSAAEADSGTLRFSVTNDGRRRHRVLPARRGRPAGRSPRSRTSAPASPATSSSRCKPGTYFTACKPGMVGDGIRAEFTVNDSGAEVGPTGDTADQLAAAEASYVAYVKDQVGALIAGTQAFADAYTAGDDETAKSLYADTRAHWERVEPVAESFGDLDPLLDLREADVEEGAAWSGWHLIEKDLWQPAPDANGGVDVRAADARAARRGRGRPRRPTRSSSSTRSTPPTSRSRRSRSPTAPRSCSTRSPPARSPARRRSGRTPTCGTSRPTSTARASGTRCSRTSSRPRTPTWPRR